MSLFGKGYSRYSHAELRKVCDLLEKKHKLTLKLDDKSDRPASYDIKSETVSIGTADIWLNGVDYYVGLILHEVGHARYTPKKTKVRACARGVYNMLEDERMEALLDDEYEGAAYYLGEHWHRAAQRVERYLQKPPPYPSSELIYVPSGNNKYVVEMYRRVLASAMLLAHGYAPRYKTRCTEADMLAAKIATICRRARYESALQVQASADEVAEMLNEAGILPPIPQKGEGEGEWIDPRQAAERSGMGSSGYGYAPSGASRTSPKYYQEADMLAAIAAPALKRKVLRTLRENERTRYEGGKKRGTLDKKQLARTARDNYRIYSRRVLPKGKKYAAMIVLDTSGSMWGADKIERGMYSACMMLRTLRGLGYPTGLVLYGAHADVLVDPRDIYDPKAVAETIKGYTCAIYNSGDNETHEGIRKALPRLYAAGVGRTKLLIIITDGGLYGRDVEESPRMIEEARKRGVHTQIYYVEMRNSDTVRLLNDPERERDVLHAADLPVVCTDLMRRVAYSEVDAE